PSEAEYEYAATSRGERRPYPWSGRRGTFSEPTCGDKDGKDGSAVIYGNDGYGCGAGGTMPVCSKPKGNTDQGLGDMSGEVWEWMQDTWHGSYEGAPKTGKAWDGGSPIRALRGGSFLLYAPMFLRPDYRRFAAASVRHDDIGFRLARSKR